MQVGTWRTRPLIWRLLLAAAIVAVLALVRVAFLGHLDSRFLYVVFYPAVIAAAIVGGLGAGVLAATLSALFVCVFTPMHEPAEWLALIIFLIGDTIIIAIAEVLRAAQARVAQLERARQGEAHLNAFVEQAPVALAMFDRGMRYLSASARWKFDYGLTSDVVGRSHYEVFPEIPERWKVIHQRALGGEVVRADDEAFPRADGSVQWLRWEVRPWYREAGDVGGIMIFSEDISERKRAEGSVHASEARLRAIVDSALEAILVIDEHGLIQSANAAAERMFGYLEDELAGRNIRVLMPEKYAVLHDDYLAEYRRTGVGKIIGVGREVEGRRRDGSIFPLDLTVGEWRDADGRRFFTGSLRDISVRKQAQEALARSGRVEAVGRLAGGIAHDFNNLLAIISGNLELAELRIEDETARQFIRKALAATERGASFNKRLLAFARQRPLEPQRLLLNPRIREMIELLTRTLGEQISVRADLAPEVWPVLADPGEIDSVLTNLALNARDAMPQGGELVVATRNVTLDERAAELDPEAVAGDYVVLSVADSGTGMASSVLQRAIEPFFTTKEPGKGTGLGLSSVFGFAKQSGGFFVIDSEIGKGTTARVYLRRAGQDFRAATAAADVPRGNRETILVVEDDDALRDVTRKRLESLGYRILEAANVDEATARLESAAPIALVFSDVVMPGGKTGYDLARWIRRSMPHVKLLLTSGYNSKNERGEEPIDIPLLDKPYSLAQLAHSVSDALASPSARTPH